VSAALPDNAVQPRTLAEWRRWLARNHDRGEGVWLAMFKKASGKARFDYGEAVEEALCFGWIDSRGRALDEERTMLWMAPRKAASGWSKSNKERIKRLVADKRMAAPGLAKIAAAKKDGSWTLLDAVEALEIPPDLGRALDAKKKARAGFEAFTPSTRRAILAWLNGAKRPETRKRRIAETAKLAAVGIPVNS